MFNWFKKKPEETIKFYCEPVHYGVIPAPVPAVKFLPEWYKKLPAVDVSQRSVNDSGITIKRCLPFLDAMTTGYMLLTPADIHIRLYNNGMSAETASNYGGITQSVVSAHKAHQIAGAPESNRIALKFHTFWTIITPPGWSTLFCPPLNRPHPFFDTYAGIVDTDEYSTSVNMPFFMKGPDDLYIIEKGTPICQVIPFKRADFKVVVGETPPEVTEKGFKQANNVISTSSFYRQFIRAKR